MLVDAIFAVADAKELRPDWYVGCPWGTFKAYLAWLIKQQDEAKEKGEDGESVAGARPPERGDDGTAKSDPYGFSKPPKIPRELGQE
jgi:hypothetical protein